MKRSFSKKNWQFPLVCLILVLLNFPAWAIKLPDRHSPEQVPAKNSLSSASVSEQAPLIERESPIEPPDMLLRDLSDLNMLGAYLSGAPQTEQEIVDAVKIHLDRSLVTPIGLINQSVEVRPVSCLLQTVALLQDTASW